MILKGEDLKDYSISKDKNHKVIEISLPTLDEKLVERSKIDKAIKEIENLRTYDHEDDYYDCKYEILDILKRNIESESRFMCKLGKWIIIDDCEKFIARCSNCGKVVDSRRLTKQCERCGIKMEILKVR